MKLSAITGVLWLVVATSAFAQSKSTSDAPASSAPSKASLSEVRATVHELEGQTDKLRELLENHRELVAQRPQPQGSGAEGKKWYDEQLAKWETALDRLLTRIESAHALVAATLQRLDKSTQAGLPTALAKDVARVRNEADPERATAEQVLAQRKPAARKAKPAAANDERPQPSNEDIDL